MRRYKGDGVDIVHGPRRFVDAYRIGARRGGDSGGGGCSPFGPRLFDEIKHKSVVILRGAPQETGQPPRGDRPLAVKGPECGPHDCRHGIVVASVVPVAHTLSKQSKNLATQDHPEPGSVCASSCKRSAKSTMTSRSATLSTHSAGSPDRP